MNTKIEQDPIAFANTALDLCDDDRDRAKGVVEMIVGLDPNFKKAVLFQLNISDVRHL